MGDTLADPKEYRVASRLTHFTQPSPGPCLAELWMANLEGAGRSLQHWGWGTQRGLFPVLAYFSFRHCSPPGWQGARKPLQFLPPFCFQDFFFMWTIKKTFFFSFIYGCAGSSLLRGFSLVSESQGYSLVTEHRLLTVIASLIAEHGL